MTVYFRYHYGADKYGTNSRRLSMFLNFKNTGRVKNAVYTYYKFFLGVLK